MSLQIFKSGRRQAVLIADGLATGEFSTRSDVPKLWPAGRYTACGIVGLTEFAIADEVSDHVELMCSNPTLQDNPRALLEAMRDDFRPRAARVLAANPRAFAWQLRDSNRLFGAYCVRRTPSGEIDLWELKFSFSEKFGAITLDEPILENHGRAVVFFLGFSESLRWNPLLPIKPDAPDRDLLHAIDETLAAEKANPRSAIGGVLEVALIDEKGFRWIRRDRMKRSPFGWSRRKLSRIAEEVRMRWQARLKRAA